MNTFVKE